MQSEIDNAVEEVLIYPDRAMVTRKAVLTYSPGKHTFAFNHLSPVIKRDSINVRVEGNAPIKMEGVDLREERLEVIKNDALKQLTDELLIYNDQLQELNVKAKRLVDSRKMLANTKSVYQINFMNQFYNKISTTDDFSSLLAFFNDNLGKISGDEVELARTKLELTKKISALKKELAAKQKARFKQVLNAVVTLDVGGEEDFAVYLTYIVPNAGWKPVYDARVFFNEGEIELAYYGDVSQLTGDDWDDVQVFLSTATPGEGASIPPLKPHFIGLGGIRQTGGMMTVGLGMVKADVIKAGSYVNFKIAHRETVPSDGSHKKVLIAKKRFPLEFEYKAIPRQIEHVFVYGRLVNDTDFPFLAGTVKVFHEGDYIGDSYTKTIVSGQPMELSLGIDEGFKIKRELVNRLRSKKGLTASHIGYTYTYKITLNNYKGVDHTVTIIEPVPIPKNKEIKIKRELVTDKVEPDEKGFITWVKDIKKDEEVVLELVFSVEYPEKRQIIGLDVK